MQKKLIYVMNQYSNNSVQHFYHIMNLLSAIADKGIKIALVIEKCEDAPKINHKNIVVICQKQKVGFKRGIELLGILRKLIESGYSKIFIRISINAAIISIFASKIFGGRTYYWQSGTTFEVDKDRKLCERVKWYVLSYSRLIIVKRFVDNFVTGPETMVDYYIKALKVDPLKMLLLYNDIDIKRFSAINSAEKLALRELLGFRKDEMIVLMVHRLSPVRKTDKYIPALFDDNFFEENNARLLIIGDGPEKVNLAQKIEKSRMKGRIELLGSRPNSEIEQFYKISDIFINPSYTEGFPRVVIEAMACGLPVIATNAGGTIDIFDTNQKAFVIDRDDVNLFKEKIKELLLDDNLKAILSNENLIRVRKFSTENVSDMYIERIFKDV